MWRASQLWLYVRRVCSNVGLLVLHHRHDGCDGRPTSGYDDLFAQGLVVLFQWQRVMVTSDLTTTNLCKTCDVHHPSWIITRNISHDTRSCMENKPYTSHATSLVPRAASITYTYTSHPRSQCLRCPRAATCPLGILLRNLTSRPRRSFLYTRYELYCGRIRLATN